VLVSPSFVILACATLQMDPFAPKKQNREAARKVACVLDPRAKESPSQFDVQSATVEDGDFEASALVVFSFDPTSTMVLPVALATDDAM